MKLTTVKQNQVSQVYKLYKNVINSFEYHKQIVESIFKNN